jgi:type II secretion system protein N
VADLALPGPLNIPWVRRLLAPVAFVATFLLMLYLTFPYEVLGQRIETEARQGGWDVSIGKLGPAGLLGLRARTLTAKQHDAMPGAAPLEVRLDRVDLHPHLLQLLLRQIAVGFDVESFGGEAKGTAKLSNDTKAPGLAALQLDVSDIDLKQLPPSLAQGLEMTGRLAAKCDVNSLQVLEAAGGKVSLTLKGAAILKGMLKLGEGMNFPAPKVLLGDFNGSVTIDRGTAKIEQAKLSGGDIEADLDGTIKLKPLLSLSQAEIHVRFKPKDAWLEANPLIKSSLGFLGPKGSDGYNFTLTGPLSRLTPRPGR